MMLKQRWVLMPLFTVRVASVFLVQTAFVPDEYWQSLEVAHNMAFGYGYLTWEWRKGIRSAFYPSLVALQYIMLKIFGLDTVQMLDSSEWKYLLFVGLACLIRPTAAIFWFPLCLKHWCHRSLHYWPRLLASYVLVGTVSLFLLIIADFTFYKDWTFSPYNFLLFNWTQDIGAMYGSHPWHWYFTHGFFVVMTTHLIPFIQGLKLPQVRPLIITIFWFVAVFSFLSHKEFRFLLPVLPLAMCVCGAGIQQYNSHFASTVIAVIILLINIPLALYTGIYHQRGTLDVMNFLGQEIKSTNDTIDILFLMPCHSTPFYSHIHRNVSMRFLTCEPNFEEISYYKDEADIFFCNPTAWLEENIKPVIVNSNVSSQPSHLVLFDSLHSQISSFLEAYNYDLCFQTFHTHFPETRTGRNVFVFSKRNDWNDVFSRS
ncbi:phosphatidylinositol glycan anchor biosynthesis class B isoform X2 [Tachypleus tridentatus]|uniref:phosphatidylinositol glycan anchor biosynthesis class B isoform X2 n=1 Tax=Tachypleus tridentatus TaxID=6853 RepID=UPI003FD57127